MSTTLYVCLETFNAGNGRRFKKDETVSTFVINSLSLPDRKKFKLKDDSSAQYSRDDTALNAAVDASEGLVNVFANGYVGMDVGIDDTETANKETNNDADKGSSFGGFGDGDTGGGGSSDYIDTGNSNDSSSSNSD